MIIYNIILFITRVVLDSLKNYLIYIFFNYKNIANIQLIYSETDSVFLPHVCLLMGELIMYILK